MSQFHAVVVKALHQTLHSETPITLSNRKKSLKIFKMHYLKIILIIAMQIIIKL